MNVRKGSPGKGSEVRGTQSRGLTGESCLKAQSQNYAAQIILRSLFQKYILLARTNSC